MVSPALHITVPAATAMVAAQFSALINSLPNGTSPFPAIQLDMANKIYPSSHPNYPVQLKTLSALLGLVTFLFGLGLAVRAWKGTLWLFRLDNHHGRTLIVPHYTNTFSALVCFGTGLEQGFIWTSIYFVDKSDEHLINFALWRTIVFLPVWLAFWFAAWSLLASHVTHVTTSRDKIRWFESAISLNLYGIGLSIALIVAVSVTSVIANTHFNLGADSYSTLSTALDAAEQAWNGTVDETRLQTVVVAAAGVLVHMDSFIGLFRNAYAMYSAFGIIVTATFVVTAVLHLRTLSETMKAVSSDFALPTPRERVVIIQLKKQYRDLSVVVVLFTMTTVFYIAVFFFTMGDAKNVIADGNSNEAATLLGLYTFVVLGLPISLFLISKSLEQTPSAMGPPESAELDESKNWNSASSRAGDPTFVPVPLTSHSPRPSDFGTIGSDASEEYYQPYVTRSPGMQDGTGSGKSEKGMLS